jgi:hypothetical protein
VTRDDAPWVAEMEALVEQYRSGVPPTQWFPASTKTYWIRSFSNFARFLAAMREVPRVTGVPVFRCHALGDSADVAGFSISYIQTNLNPPIVKLPLAKTQNGTEEACRWLAEIIWNGNAEIRGRFVADSKNASALPLICQQARLEHLRDWIVGLTRFCRIHDSGELRALNYYREVLSESCEGSAVIRYAVFRGVAVAANNSMLKVMKGKCKGRVFVGVEPFQLLSGTGKLYHSGIQQAINANMAHFDQTEIDQVIQEAFARATTEACDWLWI